MTRSSDGAVVVDPAPFDLAPAGADGGGGRGRAAALCLHGLTGTPYEVRPLGEAVARRGIRALGPALPGHNETPEQLAKLPYTAWLEAARAALNGLRAGSDRVFVVGLSMGGLLTLSLAAEERVDAIVVVGTPMELHSPLARLVGIAKYFHPMLTKQGGSDIRDDAARERHPGYPVMPLASVQQIMRLQRRVRGLLARVTTPILVARGALDQTSHASDAEQILSGVSSPVRERVVLESSGHVVPVDVDGAELARAVADFLGRHR